MGDVALQGSEDPVLGGPYAWAGVAYDGVCEPIAEARRFISGFLTQLQEEQRFEVSSRVAGVVQLIVSELVTNARKYAPGPCVVNVELARPVLEITVWDTDPILPVARAADPGRIGGHGLEIVTALCEGFEAQREPIGKRITARVPVEPTVG